VRWCCCCCCVRPLCPLCLPSSACQPCHPASRLTQTSQRSNVASLHVGSSSTMTQKGVVGWGTIRSASGAIQTGASSIVPLQTYQRIPRVRRQHRRWAATGCVSGSLLTSYRRCLCHGSLPGWWAASGRRCGTHAQHGRSCGMLGFLSTSWFCRTACVHCTACVAYRTPTLQARGTSLRRGRLHTSGIVSEPCHGIAPAAARDRPAQ